MAEQKGLGSKLLGIFVETDARDRDADPADGGKSPAEVLAELAQQSDPSAVAKKGAPASRLPSAPAAPEPASQSGLPPNLRLERASPPPASGPVDFMAIFREAGMDAAELDRVKKAEELLKSLPEATPTVVKKQIVEASLKAFGFEIDKIVAAAQNQKKALDAYVRVNESATAKSIQDAEAQIRAYTEKIAALRSDIEKRTAQLTSLSLAAQTRKGEVQKVLEFFQAPAEASVGAPSPAPRP